MVTSFSDLKGKNRHKNLADIYTGQQTLEPAAPATPQPYQLGGVDVGIDPWGLGVTQSLMPQPLTQGGLPLAEPVPPMPVGGGIPRGEPVPAKPQVNNLKKLKPNPNTPVTPAVAPVTSPAPETPDFNYLPSQAIIEKFTGARDAIKAAKDANELANDPELTRAKANNDLMSSIFAANAAQIGSTFGKDMSQQTAALKDSFKASNAAMDAQLTQADRMAKEADLNARQSALGADEEKAQLDNLKQQIGITTDKQTAQLNALKLVADSKSLQELDSPVPEVQRKLLASKGLNIPPGTTNRQLKGMSDMLQSEMTYKNQLALENVRARNQENLLRKQEEAKANQPKENAAVSAITTDAGKQSVVAGRAAQSALRTANRILAVADPGGPLAGLGNRTAVSSVNEFPILGTAAKAVKDPVINRFVGMAKELSLKIRNSEVGKDANMNTNELNSALDTMINPGATVADIIDATREVQKALKGTYDANFNTLESIQPGLGKQLIGGASTETTNNNQSSNPGTLPPLTTFDAWAADQKAKRK